MAWIIIFALTAASVIAGIIYMTTAIGRFKLLRSVKKRWQRWMLSFGIIALGFAICAFLMTPFNAVIVFLHVLIFFLLTDLIVRMVKVVTKRDYTVNWQGWSALLAAAVYLSVGYYLCMNVWQTDYTLYTDKLSENVRVAVFADSHIGTTFDGEGFAEHIEKIKEQSPDIVLIPGDYVDNSTSRADMIRACQALGSIDAKYGVWFAFGNHDKGYYSGRDFSADDLIKELEKNGVRVLEDEFEYTGDVCVIGRADASTGARKEMSELLDAVDTDKYIIVLDHEPSDYENQAGSTADLVVSGHTHGGQVIPLGLIGELLGMNDMTYGHKRIDNTDFIVTSGISDWAFWFKTGTKSEYVIIELRGSET